MAYNVAMEVNPEKLAIEAVTSGFLDMDHIHIVIADALDGNCVLDLVYELASLASSLVQDEQQLIEVVQGFASNS